MYVLRFLTCSHPSDIIYWYNLTPVFQPLRIRSLELRSARPLQFLNSTCVLDEHVFAPRRSHERKSKWHSSFVTYTGWKSDHWIPLALVSKSFQMSQTRREDVAYRLSSYLVCLCNIRRDKQGIKLGSIIEIVEGSIDALFSRRAMAER